MLLNKIFGYSIKQMEFTMKVLSNLNDWVDSAEEIKKMTNEERQLLFKYTKPKKTQRANWKAFCVLNFLKLKPKLEDAIQNLSEDPNNKINEIDGVIYMWQVKEYKESKMRFNNTEGKSSTLFNHEHKTVVFEYAAEIRELYGKDKKDYSNVDDYSEITVWGVPLVINPNEGEELLR